MQPFFFLLWTVCVCVCVQKRQKRGRGKNLSIAEILIIFFSRDGNGLWRKGVSNDVSSGEGRSRFSRGKKCLKYFKYSKFATRWMPGREVHAAYFPRRFSFQGESLAESFAGGGWLAAGGGRPLHKRFDLNFIPADYGCRFRPRRFDSIPDRSGSPGRFSRFRPMARDSPPPNHPLVVVLVFLLSSIFFSFSFSFLKIRLIEECFRSFSTVELRLFEVNFNWFENDLSDDYLLFSWVMRLP